MGNDVGVDPRNRFSSVPIFSLPQRRENGCREAVWGPESPPSGAIDPHAPPASVASTSVSFDSGTRVPDPVSCRRSARAKKKLKTYTQNPRNKVACASRTAARFGDLVD